MIDLLQVSVMNKARMLIAETDDVGRVAWLWCADDGKRPSPVKNPDACLKNLHTFTLHGASRHEIEAWLRCQMH
ncbi:MAG: hypothetical protein FJX25_05285 [Alphaproteobacteria bacterium]|nr:hypothetical protein [Alphaproteobacteria bacterium]